MMEEERVAKINRAAVGHLEDWLVQLEKEEVDGDDLLASMYGAMIAAFLMGYDPGAMVAYAKTASERLQALADEES